MKRLLVSLALGSALAPLGAAAADEDVAKQLAAMQAHMAQLEDKLTAATDQLAAAEKRLGEQDALVATEAVDASSGLAPFLDTIEISGFAAATYFYNFNNPDGPDLAGSNAPVDLLHPDSNSFSLDQLWFSVSRSISPEQRAGFRADFVYGKTASILSGDNLDGGAGNDFDLYQGYIQYLAPIGEGVTIQAGKFATLIGAEVASSKDNWNITRGNVYNFLQPINHTGILASTPIGPVNASFGFVDETRAFPALNADANKNKALLFSLSGGGETVSASFAGTYGRAPLGTTADDKEFILDGILRFNPSETISTYVNVDYVSMEDSATVDTDAFGIAGAARVAFTESTGLAGRVEYVKIDPDGFGEFGIWGITGTLDHKLTDALTLRGEVRFDSLTEDGQVFYIDEDSGLTDDQVTAGVELLYGF